LALESVNYLIGYSERWSLPLLGGAVIEIKPASLDG
jgi:hypothetical protein